MAEQFFEISIGKKLYNHFWSTVLVCCDERVKCAENKDIEKKHLCAKHLLFVNIAKKPCPSSSYW